MNSKSAYSEKEVYREGKKPFVVTGTREQWSDLVNYLNSVVYTPLKDSTLSPA